MKLAFLSLVIIASPLLHADPYFVNGPKAEALMGNLIDAGAYVDCGMGMCGVRSENLNCIDDFCKLSVQSETGEMTEVTLRGPKAMDLIEVLSNLSLEPSIKSVDCLFPNSPNEPPENTKCTIEEF